MLRCSDCGHELTKEEFDQICFADCTSKDHFIGLVEDGECPECAGGVLEEVDDREAAYQQGIKSEVQAEMKIVAAYPALFDTSLYAEQMKDTGRGRLLRGGS